MNYLIGCSILLLAISTHTLASEQCSREGSPPICPEAGQPKPRLARERAPTDITFNYAGGGPFGAFNPPVGLYRHALNNPSANTPIGAINPGNNAIDLLVGLDNRPDGSLIGLAGQSPAPTRLVNVDTATAALTTIVPLTGVVGIPVSIAVDPRTGAAFVGGFDTADVGGGSRIYRLNTSTGVATALSIATTTEDLIIDLSIDCQGVLFGVTTQSDKLFRVNTANGMVLPVSDAVIGFDIFPYLGANGLDFDNANGTLYAFLTSGDNATFAFTGSFYGAIDTQSGIGTGATLGLASGILATPGACPVASLFADGFE
jgi:hypothetical protein